MEKIGLNYKGHQVTLSAHNEAVKDAACVLSETYSLAQTKRNPPLEAHNPVCDVTWVELVVGLVIDGECFFHLNAT